MKYCPQCNRQFTEPWITFCSDDGTLLIEDLSPPVDPNWNPKIRERESSDGVGTGNTMATAAAADGRWLGSP